MAFVPGRSENNVVRGENAGNQLFLLYPNCFQTTSFFMLLCPPSTKWRYIAWQMSVGRVGRPYLVWMITRHRIDLGLSNLAQTCVSGCRWSLLILRSKVKVTVTYQHIDIHQTLSGWLLDTELTKVCQIWHWHAFWGVDDQYWFWGQSIKGQGHSDHQHIDIHQPLSGW